MGTLCYHLLGLVEGFKSLEDSESLVVLTVREIMKFVKSRMNLGIRDQEGLMGLQHCSSYEFTYFATAFWVPGLPTIHDRSSCSPHPFQ